MILDMQYTLDEIRTFIAKPDQYSQHYTATLLNDLIETLFPDDSDEVQQYLTVLPEHANSLRVQIACVHLSVLPESQSGDIDKVIQNIDLASQDYRDLLMAYYL